MLYIWRELHWGPRFYMKANVSHWEEISGHLL
jgi:hypothetical protein